MRWPRSALSRSYSAACWKSPSSWCSQPRVLVSRPTMNVLSRSLALVRPSLIAMTASAYSPSPMWARQRKAWSTIHGTVVHVCCSSFPLLTEDDCPLELSTPVRRSSKPQGMSDDILEASRLTDAQGLFELYVSFEKFPVHLVHCTEVNKTPRYHPLVTGFLGNVQGLFAQSLRLRNVVPRERRQ